MFKDYLFYAHNGSADHNQEAIIRATAQILNINKNDLLIMSANMKQDKLYGIDEISNDIIEPLVLNPNSLAYIKYITKQKFSKSVNLPMPFSPEDTEKMSLVKVALSVGGDNYCYEGFSNTLDNFNDFFICNGVDTVLWGCSINPELLEDKDLVNNLKKYSVITARETKTYKALIKAGIDKAEFYPDPSFILKPKMKDLPVGFDQKKTIGINISSFLTTKANDNDLIKKSVINLIDFIINKTSMQIALIPYSIANGNDDRIVLEEIYENYTDTDRVIMIDDCKCTELKGFIARCAMFISSNIGASIAAYSCCVPTVMLGENVSSKGIISDIFGTTKDYLVSAENITENSLIDSMQFLVMNYNKIKTHLQKSMPVYCQQAFRSSAVIKKFL